ncbi:MAG: ABC transporter substrate-binding protein [Clostridia bacterium]|nr:ABC transporter substrate-binding protein [Clostridia bacterium]
MRSITSIFTPIRHKRLLALLLAALLTLPHGAAAEMMTDVGVHLGIISVATTQINPLTPVEREFMSLTGLIYEGLMYLDDNYQPQPCLAERYSSSADGKTWFFYLREGVTFHDGTALSAYDVAATANEILRLADDGAGRYKTLKYFVNSIEASDSRTVVVRTGRANYGFLYAMTFPVLKAGEVQSPNPVGTGAYMLEMFEPAVYMLLSAYTGWWQNLPENRQILVNFFSTNRELISAYEYSNVDAVLTRAITAAQYRSGVSSYNIDFRATQLETLLMNNRSTELSDVQVRQAIRYMINMDDIVNNVYYGMVTRTDTPMIPGTWTYWNGDYRQEYNKQKANELLDAAGWDQFTESDAGNRVRTRMVDGKKANLHLRFYVYEEQDNSVRVEVANRIADSLLEVGIECTVDTLTYKEAAEKLKAGSYDLCLAAFNIDFTPDPGYLLISGNTANYMRYKSSEMDTLIQTTLRGAMDYSDYSRALQEIQNLFWQDCPLVCLYYRNGAILTRRMFTDARDVREPEVLRGIEYFKR